MRNIATLLVCACLGCVIDTGAAEEGETGDGQNPDPHATFETNAEFGEVCGQGASAARLVATRVDCEHPPPAPCTLQTNPYLEYAGAEVACPFEGSVLLSTEVLQSGRYRVEIVGQLDGGGEQRICQGIGQVDKHLVTGDDLDMRTAFSVATLDGSPCDIP